MQEPQSQETPREYRFQGFHLDLATHSLLGPDGEPRLISGRAIDALQLLIEHRGEPLSKDFLIEKIWPDTFVQENNLNQVISSIRKALGDSKNDSKFIKTLIGKGYCFVAELDPQAPLREPEPVTAVPLTSALPSRVITPPAPKASPSLALYALAALCVLGAGTWLLAPPRNAPPDAPFATATRLQTNTPAGSTIMPGSVAVMPFTALAPDIQNAESVFALGLHDEIINQLSQVPGLKVVSRESVLAAANRQLYLPDIGRLLNVESVITGSIVYSERDARIKLQKLDPYTGIIDWSFDHDIGTDSLKDMLFTQSDIAQRVTRGLRSDINTVSIPAIQVTPTESFEAYRYNLAARRAYFDHDFDKSLALSKKALALDPDFHGALYNFSRAHYYLSSSPQPGMTTADHLKLGLESAQRLIELAPEKHEGYVLRAIALASMGHWEDAMADVRRLEDTQSPLWEMQPLAPVLMSLGQFDTTIAILENSLQISPLNSNTRGFLTGAYEAVGNSVQARLEYDMGEELTPEWWGDVVNFFLVLGRGEQYPDLQAMQGTSDEVKDMLAGIYRGDIEGVDARLRARLHEIPPSSSRLVHYAAVAAAIDDQDLAVEFLAHAAQILPLHLHWIWQPVFADTWQHPALRKLLEQSGLMAYWRRHGKPEICATHPTAFVCSDREITN